MLLIHYKYIFIKDGLEKVDIRANRILTITVCSTSLLIYPKIPKLLLVKLVVPLLMLKISLECFQKELDKDILSLIKQQEFKFSALKMLSTSSGGIQGECVLL